MPGMAGWKQLYRTEYEQLFEEGYPVGDKPIPDMDAVYVAAAGADGGRDDDSAWERAYHELVKIRRKGLRDGYQYNEPNGLDEILADAVEGPELQGLDDREYEERIAGAWNGRCAGVTLGKPVEMVLMDGIKEYLQSVDSWPLNDYIPPHSEKLDKWLKCHDATAGSIAYVPVDDDVSYTVTALTLLEQKGAAFSPVDVCRNWLANLPYNRLYSCTKQAYYNLVRMGWDGSDERLVEELPLMVNPMREGLNASIRIDCFGYVVPADSRAAAALAHRNASVNSVKNGIYAAMFVAACISAALSKEPSVEKIMQAGLSVIPKRSRLAEAIHMTDAWYREHGEWEPVCEKIYQRWGHLNWAGAMYNYPLVALALLHGGLDFTRTITTAVMCGVDTDCTAGTVGSIVGAAVGLDGIDARWYKPFNDRVKTFVAGNGGGDGTLSDLIRRTVACRAKIRAA
jgi:ADP-ribosylglycohydrolase